MVAGSKYRIAFFLPSLHGGGAERVTVNLIKAFINKGYKVDLVLVKAEGIYLNDLPEDCRIIDLGVWRVVTSLPKLVRYLYRVRPDVIISGLGHANVIALISKMLARVQTRIIVTEHSVLSLAIASHRSIRAKFISFLINLTYPRADAIIAVSRGVADDLKDRFGFSEDKLKVIYNPIVNKELLIKAGQLLEHPWFQEGEPPVILSAGRLTKAKDFSSLLRAFAMVRRKIDCRLVILGEGEERSVLDALAIDLGIDNELWMPGFVNNPYQYMSRAAVFVLSSRREGFGNVIVEAMACTVPVVAADCPSGPAEIIANNENGILVPVGNVEAMANNILKILLNQEFRDQLIVKGQQRAQYFTVDAIAEEYLQYIHILVR